MLVMELPKKSFRFGIIVVVVLAVVGCASASAWYFTHAVSKPSLTQSQKNAFTAAQKETEQKTEAVKQHQVAVTQQAAAKGCISDIDAIWNAMTERGKWYKTKDEQKTDGRGVLNIINMQLDAQKTSCANGVITPDKQQAFIDTIPNQLADTYKKLYGNAAYVTAEAQFK